MPTTPEIGATSSASARLSRAVCSFWLACSRLAFADATADALTEDEPEPEPEPELELEPPDGALPPVPGEELSSLGFAAALIAASCVCSVALAVFSWARAVAQALRASSVGSAAAAYWVAVADASAGETSLLGEPDAEADGEADADADGDADIDGSAFGVPWSEPPDVLAGETSEEPVPLVPDPADPVISSFTQAMIASHCLASSTTARLTAETASLSSVRLKVTVVSPAAVPLDFFEDELLEAALFDAELLAAEDSFLPADELAGCWALYRFSSAWATVVSACRSASFKALVSMVASTWPAVTCSPTVTFTEFTVPLAAKAAVSVFFRVTVPVAV